MKPRYLTKSLFKLAVECPTKLFYAGKQEYNNTMREDAFLKMLADGGFQVGELARLMYPGGHEIKSKNHAEAEAETAEWLKQDEVILFEPAIRFGDLFIRIDILVKRGNTFRIIEVKAKSYYSEKPALLTKMGGIASDVLPYIEDVAFQFYVFGKAFPDSTVTCFLMMPDKAKTATIEGLNQLFKVKQTGKQTEIITDPRIKVSGYGGNVLEEVNIDELVGMVMVGGVSYPGGKDTLPRLAQRWSEAYKNDERIPQVIGAQCGMCEFRAELHGSLKSGFHECWKSARNFDIHDFANGTVLDLWNFRGKDELIDRGICKLSQVTQGDLKYEEADEGLSNSRRQWMQVSGLPEEFKERGFYLDCNLIRSEMATWKFPYHFIDFETSAVALPFYKGMRPYEQVAFQFSHHVMRSDGTVEHVGEFLLSEPGKFPNYVFSLDLKEQLERDDGSVFMWSHHENTILNRIIIQLQDDSIRPDYADELITFLKKLIKGGDRAMVDLCALAQKAYFHPDTKGSNSIKKLLPAVLNTSDFLRKKYRQPIYGADGGVRSKNYRNQVWWAQDASGKIIDPYHQLKTNISDMLGANEDGLSIADGGAATSAYSRLQFESLTSQDREKINQALLRYCELDTLAMVMIVEAWRDFCKP